MGTDAPSGIGLTRDYTREPEVEAEIARLSGVATPGFVAAAGQARHLETLVYAIHQLLRAGRAAEADALAEKLFERASEMLAKAARSRFPHMPDLQEEVLQETARLVWKAVSDTSPTSEFWEVHFEEALIRASRSAAKPLYDRLEKEKQHLAPVSRDDEEADAVEVQDTAIDIERDLLDSEAFHDALFHLDEKARLSLRLLAEGLTQKEVAATLGITDRTVRNHLTKAVAALEPAARSRRLLA